MSRKMRPYYRLFVPFPQFSLPIVKTDAATGKPVPKAIHPGAPTDRVLLILFVTSVHGTTWTTVGLNGSGNSSVPVRGICQ